MQGLGQIWEFGSQRCMRLKGTWTRDPVVQSLYLHQISKFEPVLAFGNDRNGASSGPSSTRFDFKECSHSAACSLTKANLHQ